MELLLLDIDELDERPGFLYTGGAAAHHHEGEHLATGCLVILMLVGPLEHVKHMVPDVQGLLQGLHAVGVLCHFLHAKEIVGGAGCQHQIVIADLPVVGEEHFALLVYPLGLGHEELHILVLTEEIADGISNLLSAQHGSGKLIQQGLEQMVIVTIHQEHIHVLPGQILSQLDAAEAAAYYDYFFPVCHEKNLPNTYTIQRVYKSEKFNFNM